MRQLRKFRGAMRPEELQIEQLLAAVVRYGKCYMSRGSHIMSHIWFCMFLIVHKESVGASRMQYEKVYCTRETCYTAVSRVPVQYPTGRLQPRLMLIERGYERPPLMANDDMATTSTEDIRRGNKDFWH